MEQAIFSSASRLRAPVSPMGSGQQQPEGATQSGNLLLPQKPVSPSCLRCCASARAGARSYGECGGGGLRALFCRLLYLQKHPHSLFLAFGSHVAPMLSVEQGRRTYPCLPPPRAGRNLGFPVMFPLPPSPSPGLYSERNPGWRKMRNKDGARFVASEMA